jgi:hypothetical protein
MTALEGLGWIVGVLIGGRRIEVSENGLLGLGEEVAKLGSGGRP